MLMFLYRLFLSFIFPNIKLRHFFRFFSVTRSRNCGILDTYTMSNSFMFYKILAGKRYLIEQDPIAYCAGVIGMKRFMRPFFGRE